MPKKQLASKPDYSFSDRLLHRLALGVPLTRKMSFELETTLAKPYADTGKAGKQGSVQESSQGFINKKHIFVAGLARAGTTILMRTLYETGEFRSLTYRDMPFVLMPSLWKKVSQLFYKQQDLKERAHGDGVYVNYDSPEALEEVFWKTFTDENYILNDSLIAHQVSKNLIEQFRLYIHQIIVSSDSAHPLRYLSKNNNNILRLASIKEAFPNAIIVIPFRDPVQHAYSLLTMHKRFVKQHAEDAFSKQYMDWLGHYEFGALHKRFNFESDTEIAPSCKESIYSTSDINYWLKIWLDTYQYLYEHAPQGSLFISYDEMCASPVTTLDKLYDNAGLEMDRSKLQEIFRTVVKKEPTGVDESLNSQATHLYGFLVGRAHKIS